MLFLYHSCQICWSEAVLFLQETHQGLCGLLGFLQCQSCLKCSNFSGEISCAHAPSASSLLAKSREQVFPPLSIYRHRERGRASVETGSLTHSQRASDWGRGCRCAPPLLCVLFFSLCRKQLVIWEKRAAADRGEGEFPVASSRMHLVVDSCQDAVLKMLPYFVDNAFVTQRQIYHMWVNRSLKWNRRWCSAVYGFDWFLWCMACTVRSRNQGFRFFNLEINSVFWFWCAVNIKYLRFCNISRLLKKKIAISELFTDGQMFFLLLKLKMLYGLFSNHAGEHDQQVYTNLL